MVFSSLIFIFAYLVITLLVYYLSPLKLRNLVLFIVSLAFYGWGEPAYILLMLVSIISAYLFGFLIEKNRDTNQKKAKVFLILSLAVNLSFLLFFKYYNFFADNVGFSRIDGLTLPVGISFYTFQIMSYSIDLYRGQVPVAQKFVPIGTYVTLFPQLIAGPIVMYRDVYMQLQSRKESVSKFASGVNRFVLGLSKKIILGDSAAALAEAMEASESFHPTVIGTWLIMIAYTFHIYFDFSGYSDMAIGLGRMIGFEFAENFNYPYIARSITDFWRRWHITLSTWFRDYIYIPLGGNRVGKLRSFFNLAVVWFLTGFWHGADWNYILWGVYFWVFLVLEKAFLRKLLEKCKPVAHLYSLLVIGFGWTIFFHSDLTEIASSALRMIGIGAEWGSTGLLYTVLRWLPFLLLCGLACTPYPKRIAEWLKNKFTAAEALSPVVVAILLLISIAYMVNDTFSPFLYYIF